VEEEGIRVEVGIVGVAGVLSSSGDSTETGPPLSACVCMEEEIDVEVGVVGVLSFSDDGTEEGTPLSACVCMEEDVNVEVRVEGVGGVL